MDFRDSTDEFRLINEISKTSVNAIKDHRIRVTYVHQEGTDIGTSREGYKRSKGQNFCVKTDS